jgi:hypothetical protein
VAELLNEEVQVKRARKTGPTSKVHKSFEEVSKLPRRQQEKIVEVVSALVSQYAQGRQRGDVSRADMDSVLAATWQPVGHKVQLPIGLDIRHL